MPLLTLLAFVSHAWTAKSTDIECKRWFEKARLAPGQGCLVACTSLKTDMGTFDCPESCNELCDEPGYISSTMKLSRIYGLTVAERAVVAKEPKKALQAYVLSRRAERLCLRIFKRSRTNDESDACRHFVWAALLTRDLGLDFGNTLLNAHEQDARQPNTEKAMDLANNRQGQIAAKRLPTPLTDDAILESFSDNLKRNTLIVLKSKPEDKRDLQK